MNRKGFTLIELIATIALLAIIVMIAVPIVNGVIQKNKRDNCQILRNNIIRAAELYVSDNKYDLSWSANQITIHKSQYGEYLNSSIKNPCTNEEYSEDIIVTFKKNSGNIELVSVSLPTIFTCCDSGRV